jgi:integrase/recombinase XerD
VAAELSGDAEEYLSYLAVEKGRAPASLRSYRSDLQAYETFLRGRHLSLREVSPSVVEDYMAFLAASGRKATSNARALAALRGLHRFLEDERGGQPDPTSQVAGPRRPSPVPKALSEDQVESLLAAVPGIDPVSFRDRAILELMYASGLRISELCGLSRHDLDLEAGLVRVLGKGSKERIVPFGRPAAEALTAWLETGRPALSPPAWQRRSDEEAVFISRRGRRLGRQAAWVVVRRAAERAGLESVVTPHVLRHSCATHLLEHGADIRVVQELLGHAAITTTQVYTKVSGDLLRRAFEQAHPRARHRPSSKPATGK